MDADVPSPADNSNPSVHAIPLPPPPPADASTAFAASPEPVVANPFVYEDVPLQPGQLAPGWHTLFIIGWIGVLAAYGCIWQAGRVAGIAPWWLGPETNPRFVGLVFLPFLAPIVAIAAELARWKTSAYVGVVAGLGTAAFALGDLHFPGLAVVEAVVGLAGLLISVACLGGRMRHPERVPGATLPSAQPADPNSAMIASITSGRSSLDI